MKVNRLLLLASLTPPVISATALAQCATPTDADVMLDRVALPALGSANTAKPHAIFRSYGKVNFERADNNKPFTPLPGSPTAFNMPYGDRVGYDTGTVRDVDGDGYNDWVETWYHAEPVSAVDSSSRVPEQAQVMGVDSPAWLPPLTPPCPGGSVVIKPKSLITINDYIQNVQWGVERAGFLRFISGRTGEQIGQDIWGHADNARLAHEISQIRDVNGDDRDDVVISSNTSDWGRGCIEVYSFTNTWNLDGDPEERWACILRIVGDESTHPCDGPESSEFGYELEEMFADVNNDGQQDIISGSVWWRTTGGRDVGTTTNQIGAAWIHLMPEATLFQAIAASSTWPAAGTDLPMKAPVLLREGDWTLRVTNPPIATGANYVLPVANLSHAGDIDGDSKPDFVANAGYTYQADGASFYARGFYFFASKDGYNEVDYPGRTLANAKPRYTHLNAAGDAAVYDEVNLPKFDSLRIELQPRHADFVIHGKVDSTSPQYDYHYNVRSVFGMQLDNYPTGVPSGFMHADMALVAVHPSILSGKEVNILLNLPARFAVGGPLAATVNTVNGPGSAAPPVAYLHDNVPGGAQYRVISESETCSGPNCMRLASDGYIRGVSISGNTDGQGERDCELSIGTVRRAFNEFFPVPPYVASNPNPCQQSWCSSPPQDNQNCNWGTYETQHLNLGGSVIINIPDTPATGVVPTIANWDGRYSDGTTSGTLVGFSIRSEQYVYDFDDPNDFSIDPLTGERPVANRVNPRLKTPNNQNRVADTNFFQDLANLTDQNLAGLGCSVMWDIDGDGADDILARNAFFPALVKKLPGDIPVPLLPMTNHGGTSLYDGPRHQPYFVDGGVNYVILSRARTPAVGAISSQIASSQRIFTIQVKNVSPEREPFDTFPVHQVTIHNGTGPAIDHATAVTISPPAGNAWRTLTVTFPVTSVPATDAVLKLPTRWKNANANPLTISLP